MDGTWNWTDDMDSFPGSKRNRKPMNRFLSATVLVAFVLLPAAIATGAEPSRKPTVLMISIDDLNDWTGFLGGHPEALRPHMDALAERGRNFTNAHCAVPVCTSSRVSVMSGLAPVDAGRLRGHSVGEREKGETAGRMVAERSRPRIQSKIRAVSSASEVNSGGAGLSKNRWSSCVTSV